MPPHYPYLELSKHVMRNVSRFRATKYACAYSRGEILNLARWKWPLWQVLLCCCAKWGAHPFSLSRLVCVLSHKEAFIPFLPFLPVLLHGGPLNFACLPSQNVFDFLFHRHNKLCYFIQDIMVIIFWPANTSNKPSAWQPDWRQTLTCDSHSASLHNGNIKLWYS